MTFVNISDLAPLVVIVKLHMTNGILKTGTLRLDSVMVYHPSHTSTHFNRPRVCRCRRTCVNSQVHTFVICICRSTSCMYANVRMQMGNVCENCFRLAKRGRNFTVVATVVSTGITPSGDRYCPFCRTHGIRRRAIWGFVIWLDLSCGHSRRDHPGVEKSKSQKRL